MLHDEIRFEISGDGEPPVRRMEVVSGAGGRRRWTREAKMRIIEETLRPGANVADVARRHGLVPQQLYSWRSAVRARESEPALSFVPLALEGGGPPPASVSGGVIVVQAGDLTIHIPTGVAADHIERVFLAARMVS
jgi:transposase